jgi:hypothetical protein
MKEIQTINYTKDPMGFYSCIYLCSSAAAFGCFL